jgi:hypothetical protein
MKIAVWDTYVKRNNGTVLHFDILIHADEHDTDTIYQYGKEYLESIGEHSSGLTSEHCRFCHVEVPDEITLRTIQEKGYFILELDDIPANLPDHPSRREMILYLRGHTQKYRFANFRGVPDDEIKLLLQTLPNA